MKKPEGCGSDAIWNAFIRFCHDHGVDPSVFYWNCWVDGYNYHVNIKNEIIKEKSNADICPVHGPSCDCRCGFC